MANPKEYAYYVVGNKVGIVEKDVNFDNDPNSKDYGPGIEKNAWKSPLSSVTDGLKVEYLYNPNYKVYSSPAINLNKFYINAWTVVGGSSRWNGVHKVQTAGTRGELKTYTKVKSTLPYWEAQQIDFATDETIFDGGGGTLHLADHFSAGDYIFTGGSAQAANNGLFSVSSVTESATAASSKVTVGTKYYSQVSTTSDQTGLDVENSVAAAFTGEDDQTDINIYKVNKDFFYILTDVDVLNDESDEIDIPSYLNKALVYYVKAKMSEDMRDMEGREYFMREFRRMVEKHQSSLVKTGRFISSGAHSIR